MCKCLGRGWERKDGEGRERERDVYMSLCL